MWPWAIGAIGGALLNVFGQQQTNSANQSIASNATAANMEEAARNRAFQAQSAKEQMEFQERMSSTAYQRAVADAQAAGLNPMVIGGSSGASSPVGASGSGDAGSAVSTTLQNPLAGVGSIMSSAMEAALLDKQIEKVGAETQAVKAGTALTGAKTDTEKGSWGNVLGTIRSWFSRKIDQIDKSSAKKQLFRDWDRSSIRKNILP